MGRPTRLEPQQLRFALAVADGLPAHQAAAQAGYAGKQASRLLGKDHVKLGIGFVRLLHPKLQAGFRDLVREANGNDGQTVTPRQ